MKLSEKIIYLRKEKGWSQEQLAIKLEISRQAVYKWEADINQPDLDKLKRIANLFNVSYDILMDDSVDLPLTPNLVEVSESEIPEVEIIERTPPPANEPKLVNNEVAVQINYNKDSSRSANKKLIALLCVLASVVVISLCALSYILFGIVLQKDSYLVKFDAQGGSTVSDRVVREGDEINEFTSPTKEGYTFEGWYLGEKKWDFDKDTVKGNTTLIAKWTPNKNKITYINYNTGERYESYASTNETVALASNTFKMDGFAFIGWATSPRGEVMYNNCDTFKMGTENVTLYAVWSSDIYNLVLHLGGGRLDAAFPVTFSSSEAVTLPIPVLEFYSFDGWYDSNNNKVEIISKGTTSDVVLTARYTPIQYSISYALNGGKNSSENPNTYNATEVITFLAPERQDYSFNGWYLDENFNKPISKTELGKGGNITLYASWELSIFSFELISGGYSVIGYTGSDSIVNIPKEYNGVTVVEIGEKAFYENESITEINIPYTVTSIDVTAFEGCISLADINVENGNSEYCSDNGILYNKQKTVIHKYPMGKQDTVYTAPDSLDVIGKYAFNYAIYLEEVYLPNDISAKDGVGKISAYAFDGCISLTTIELGYIANYIEAYAFQNCWSLERVDFKAPEVYGIEKSAFENCVLLSSVTFKGKINAINDRAFYGCASLESISLNELASLGSYVFQNTGLTDVFIPITVKAMGSAVFWGCEAITVRCEVSAKPNGWATDWSTGVEKVIWGSEAESYSIFTFTYSGSQATITGVQGKGEITIPSIIEGYSVVAIGANAFTGQNEITKVTIPSNVGTIDKTAFEGCVSLESIVYDSSWTGAFGSVDGVLYSDYNKQIYKYPEGKRDESFTVPYNVDIIRAYAFKNNPYLKKVILPSDITGNNYVGKLEQGAFEGCTALTTVEGCSATYLERDVFKSCTALKEITFLADDVWGIGNYSFLNCTSLESVTFKGNMHTIGYQVFGFCESLKNVVFEGTLGSLSMHAFESCISLESITLPDGPTAMVSEVFKGCFMLKSINIPSTVTKIEDYAFLDTGITEIFIPVTVTEIEEYAFLGAAGLTIYCEADEKPSGWNDKWCLESKADDAEAHTVKWGQDGPNDISYTYSKNENGTYTLVKCQGTGSAIIPEYYLGIAITEIGENAFRSQSDIVLIRIPKTVTKIASNAFNLCYDLEKIDVDAENTEFLSSNGILYSKDKSVLIRYPMNKSDESLAVSSTVTSINDYAFFGLNNLKRVTFNGDISRIGCEAFSNVASVEEITFNGRLGVLGEKAFYWCTRLSSINLPEGLTQIPDYAFGYCNKLTSINIPSTVTAIGSYAFEKTTCESIFIPINVTAIAENAFIGAESLTIYCEAAEKPSGWNDKWNAAGDGEDAAYYTVKWGQSGLPTN